MAHHEPVTLTEAARTVAVMAIATDEQVALSVDTLLTTVAGLTENLMTQGMNRDYVYKTLTALIPKDSLIWAAIMCKVLRDGPGDPPGSNGHDPSAN